ncbi:hypothetical protein EI94DRAFT_1025547 [Lactarius quietus]|nr:hypothetical protein EI94DRAFT_1025547 [Lactarius quietus]
MSTVERENHRSVLYDVIVNCSDISQSSHVCNVPGDFMPNQLSVKKKVPDFFFLSCPSSCRSKIAFPPSGPCTLLLKCEVTDMGRGKARASGEAGMVPRGRKHVMIKFSTHDDTKTHLEVEGEDHREFCACTVLQTKQVTYDPQTKILFRPRAPQCARLGDKLHSGRAKLLATAFLVPICFVGDQLNDQYQYNLPSMRRQGTQMPSLLDKRGNK